MAKFWQWLVIVVSISLNCAYAASEPLSGVTTQAQEKRDTALTSLYREVAKIFKTCNAGLSCRQREACQDQVQAYLRKALQESPYKGILGEDDTSTILDAAYQLAVNDIFYGTLLHIKNAMSPRAWQDYKKGQRIAETYLSDLAALPTQTLSTFSRTPEIPMDIDENAVFMLLMQRSFPEGNCVSEESCTDYIKITTTISEMITQLSALKFPSTRIIIEKLSRLKDGVNKFFAWKEQQCPTEILHAIRSQLSPAAQQRLSKELKARTLSGNVLKDKERFEKEREGAAEASQVINPASEGGNQAQRNEFLKTLYQTAVSSHQQCQLTRHGQPTCLARMQAAFMDIKKAMEPRDPRQAIVDFYLKSTQELVNSVIYRGELFIKDENPDVWERYKNGPRINATEYSASLKAWANALNAPVDAKKTNKKPKANFTIDRTDVLVLFTQYLVQEEKNCQNRGNCAAAQRAFQLVKSILYNNLNGSETIAAELDSLLKKMGADALKEWPLIIASAIWRDLPPAEQAELAEPSLKDEEHFDKEMSGASKDIKSINPVPPPSTADDDKKEDPEMSNFEKELKNKAEEFALGLFKKALKKVVE